MLDILFGRSILTLDPHHTLTITVTITIIITISKVQIPNEMSRHSIPKLD